MHVDNMLAIEVKSVYGSLLFYPAGIQAKRLAGIVGTRTLTASVLLQARTMGFGLEILGDASLVARAGEVLK